MPHTFKWSQQWPLRNKQVESDKQCCYNSPDQIIVDKGWMEKHSVTPSDVKNSQNDCPNVKPYNNQAV